MLRVKDLNMADIDQQFDCERQVLQEAVNRDGWSSGSKSTTCGSRLGDIASPTAFPVRTPKCARSSGHGDNGIPQFYIQCANSSRATTARLQNGSLYYKWHIEVEIEDTSLALPERQEAERTSSSVRMACSQEVVSRYCSREGPATAFSCTARVVRRWVP